MDGVTDRLQEIRDIHKGDRSSSTAYLLVLFDALTKRLEAVEGIVEQLEASRGGSPAFGEDWNWDKWQLAKAEHEKVVNDAN